MVVVGTRVRVGRKYHVDLVSGDDTTGHEVVREGFDDPSSQAIYLSVFFSVVDVVIHRWR